MREAKRISRVVRDTWPTYMHIESCGCDRCSDDALRQLRGATRVLDRAKRQWEAKLDAAIKAGHPERTIGKAAGISGPAVNQIHGKQAEGRDTE